MTENIMDHVGIFGFSATMFAELEKHMDEKQGLKKWHIDTVQKMVVDQIESRLLLLDRADTTTDEGRAEIAKQCVHMANYLFLFWSKTKEGTKE